MMIHNDSADISSLARFVSPLFLPSKLKQVDASHPTRHITLYDRGGDAEDKIPSEVYICKVVVLISTLIYINRYIVRGRERENGQKTGKKRRGGAGEGEYQQAGP